jgi:hypothetical protein
VCQKSLLTEVLLLGSGSTPCLLKRFGGSAVSALSILVWFTCSGSHWSFVENGIGKHWRLKVNNDHKWVCFAVAIGVETSWASYDNQTLLVREAAFWHGDPLILELVFIDLWFCYHLNGSSSSWGLKFLLWYPILSALFSNLYAVKSRFT